MFYLWLYGVHTITGISFFFFCAGVLLNIYSVGSQNKWYIKSKLPCTILFVYAY